MTREERKLRKHIEEHQNRELRKRRQKEKTDRYGAPRPRFDPSIDWEEANGLPSEASRPFEKRPHRNQAPATVEGLVIGIGPGFCCVIVAGAERNCRSLAGLAVGDRVLVSDRGRVERILPRTTTLSRHDPHNPRIERVIAANIDAAVIVCSLKAPPLRPGLIDRYLIAIERGGASPVLCVNKIDLLESDADLASLEPYRELGLPVFLCSARTGEGLDPLLDSLAGKLCVFAGHSGVGKSSLLNAIHPDLGLATRAVSEVTEKGRHTTSASTLYRLPNGARIIDTPGIREFGLFELTREELHAFFHEFDAYASHCAFSDCSHTHEPRCGVRAAVEHGLIPASRYATYQRLWNTD